MSSKASRRRKSRAKKVTTKKSVAAKTKPEAAKKGNAALEAAQELVMRAEKKSMRAYRREYEKLNLKYGYKIVPLTVLEAHKIQPGESPV